MNCPRCGQKIPTTSFGRCPKCGQPLYAPLTQPSRVTKVAPESDWTKTATSVDQEGWPDLTSPSVTQPETGQLDPASATGRLPSGGRSRRLWGIVLAAAVVLIVVSGGTLLLAAGLHQRETPPKAEVGTKTVQKSRVTATSTHAAATAVATNTSRPASSPVPTQPSGGNPTANPTRPPTAVASSTPQLVTVFSDSLSGNSNGWPTDGGCSFANGGYKVDSGSQCLAPVTATDTENISVQMTSVVWTFERAGIGFRISSGQSGQQYSFYISSTGTCVAEDQVTSNTFFDNTSCSAVHQGVNAVNTLAINQTGAHMDFYVNSTLVGSADDATLSGGGIALEAQKHGTAVVFNNFVLTVWQ